MFLEKLSEFAQHVDLPPPMYQLTPIRYMIHLDAHGTYQGIDELTESKGKTTISLEAPSCKRSSGIKPKLLVDNGEYTLGIGREKSDPRRVQEQHTAYITLIHECALVTRESSVIAIEHFLLAPDSAHIRTEKPDFDPAGNIAFKVDGLSPIQLDSVKQYWAKKAAAASDTEHTMQCLVCGSWQPPVERLPIVIKGIPGGQATGLTLISANAAAFESYGLTASLIAPTCEACGEKFGNALNELLRREDTHLVIPPLAYVFWTSASEMTLDIPNLLDAEPGDVKKFFRSPWSGKEGLIDLDATAFYAATLSASGARIILRDWIELSVATVQEHLRRYFTLQQIQDSTGTIRHFSLYALINATINRDTQEKPSAQVGQALLHLALYGGQLPSSLLSRVIRRIRMSQKVQPAQAALLKMALFSRQHRLTIPQERNDDMTTMNDDCTEVAYLCGRLLAQLDYIQYRALGKVNASIVDRFYGTASTAPAVVFPRLIRGARPHLATIRQKRSKPTKGYLDYVEQELTKLVAKLPPVLPRILSLDEQAMFAIGFYHQRVHYLSQGYSNTQNTDADAPTGDEDTPVEAIEGKEE